MEEWTIYRLGDVINVLDYMRVPLSSKQREFRKGNYPYYGAQGIIDYVDSFLFDGEYLLIAEDGENLKSKKQNIAQIARGRYWVNNHAHIVESNGRCDIRYICYLLNQIDLSGYITGSAQPKLNQANLLAIEPRLPCLEVQKRVSDFLATFDDKIELNNRINHNLEAQAQALYKSWFVDFEPFRGGKFVDSELGLIPIGWDAKPLSSICHIEKKTINPQKYPTCLFTHYSIPAYDNSELPELQKGSDILSNKYIISDYTILFSKLNPRIKRIWNVYQSEANSICSTEFVVYKSMDIDTYPFLYSFITGADFYNNIMSKVNGATGSHQRFHPEETLDILVPYHIDCYRLYSQLVLPIIQQIDENKRENHYFASLRDSLLPKLMSGELKINDLTC